MISAVLHHKKQILVAEKYDGSNSCATFHTYNVMTQHRTTIDPPQHTIVPVLHKGRLGFPNGNTITTKRLAVVSNTLFYFVSNSLSPLSWVLVRNGKIVFCFFIIKPEDEALFFFFFFKKT